MSFSVIAVLIHVAVLLQSPATQGDGGATTAPAAPAQLSIENEVIANIVNQPIGDHSVADLNLPLPFLRRSADRIIRSSFEQRYRIVVDDTQPGAAQTSSSAGASATQPADAIAARNKSTRAWTIGIGLGGLVVILAALAARRRKQKRGLK